MQTRNEIYSSYQLGKLIKLNKSGELRKILPHSNELIQFLMRLIISLRFLCCANNLKQRLKF